MNTQNTLQTVDLSQLENMISQLKQIQEAAKLQSTPANKDKIKNMAEIRSHIKRLDTLYPLYNMDLLWRDSVLLKIGKSSQQVRFEYEKYWVDNKKCKYKYSFYDAVEFKYLNLGVQAIKDLEQKYGIHQTIYDCNKMSIVQKAEFNISQVVNYSNEDFQAWMERRVNDFAIMFNVPKYEESEQWFCNRQSGYAVFKMALCRAYEPYQPRTYKYNFDQCIQEFGMGHVGEDISDIYNCEDVTPIYKVPRCLIREYIIHIAEDCLVI